MSFESNGDIKASSPNSTKPKLFPLVIILVAALGLILGIYLITPVEGVVPQIYRVQEGDSLGAIAQRLGTTPESIIAANVESYPLLAEGRIRTGWDLLYEVDGPIARWQAILDPALTSEIVVKISDQIGVLFRAFRFEDSSEGRADAEFILFQCLNPYRLDNEKLPLVRDDELFDIAQARAEIMTGVRSESLTEFPLCEKCVQLTSSISGRIIIFERELARCEIVKKDWSVDPSDRALILGEFERIGLGSSWRAETSSADVANSCFRRCSFDMMTSSRLMGKHLLILSYNLSHKF